MGLSLIARNDNAPNNSKANWKAICAAAPDGFVFIREAVIDDCAKLLEGVLLSNGEVVASYPKDEYYPSYVDSFGPGLLPDDILVKLFEILEENDAAVKLLQTIVERELQISFKGKETHAPGAYIKGVNWRADEIEINRSGGNMYRMLEVLGIDTNTESESGEVAFEEFEKAVKERGIYVDIFERLEQFIECAKRNNATHVYWA